ncbi:MAG TPA: hypothetical protein VIG42_05795 [Solirubrobacteraceae bacterium]|jgi:hypothetical protein
MGVQMYMIGVKDELTQETSREIQRAVRTHDGLILMVTRTGPLVALEEAAVGALADHPLVRFIGPVSLNPRGFAAQRLEAIFSENLNKQITITHRAPEESLGQ